MRVVEVRQLVITVGDILLLNDTGSLHHGEKVLWACKDRVSNKIRLLDGLQEVEQIAILVKLALDLLTSLNLVLEPGLLVALLLAAEQEGHRTVDIALNKGLILHETAHWVPVVLHLVENTFDVNIVDRTLVKVVLESLIGFLVPRRDPPGIFKSFIRNLVFLAFG